MMCNHHAGCARRQLAASSSQAAAVEEGEHRRRGPCSIAARRASQGTAKDVYWRTLFDMRRSPREAHSTEVARGAEVAGLEGWYSQLYIGLYVAEPAPRWLSAVCYDLSAQDLELQHRSAAAELPIYGSELVSLTVTHCFLRQLASLHKQQHNSCSYLQSRVHFCVAELLRGSTKAQH